MRDKGLATAVATLLAAFATAHLMQFGLSAGRAISGEEQASPMGIATLVAWRNGVAPVSLLATPPPAGPDPVAAPLDLPDARLPPPDEAIPAALGTARAGGFGLSCDRTLTLLPLPGALVEAHVEAPCDPGIRVEVSHAGVRFAIGLGEDGRAVTPVPVLSPDATVELAFADGTILTAQASVPEAADQERVALVADGWSGLTLHAAAGVPWRGEATASPPGSGTILHLGDPGIEAPLLAQVYTAPVGRLGSLGAIGLRVEAALTPANCARDVSAEVIRSSRGVLPAAIVLRLSLPACDADGGLLVVDMPAPGLRLAHN
jgi:hypothetical protein